MRAISREKRNQIVKHLKDGLSIREASKITGVPRSTVSDIKKTDGIVILSKKGGRPPILSPQDKRFCVHQITRGGLDDSVQVTNTIESNLGVTCSSLTVRRALKEAGLASIEKPKKPLISKMNRKKRLEFALSHKHWTVDDWRRVVWSDETKINRFTSDGRLWAWIRVGEQLQSKHCKLTVKHGGGNIMVWSCITYEGVGWLAKIDTTLDKNLYLEILKDELKRSLSHYRLDESKVIFQQDNDPKHTARDVQKWLSEQNFQTMIWPSQSPDLNPIESMWAILNIRLARYGSAPKGILELFERVGENWYSITKEECRKVIDSMPERCQAVIKAKGAWINY